MTKRSIIVLLSSFMLFIVGGAALAQSGPNNTSAKVSVPLKPGNIYMWFSSGSCKGEREREVCLSREDYIAMCKAAAGSTSLGLGTLALYFSQVRYLIQNGNIDDIRVSWEDGRPYGCRLSVWVSGLIKGSSVRDSLSGGVSGFTVSGKGEILVHNASTDHR